MFDEELYEDYNSKSYRILGIISIAAVLLSAAFFVLSPLFIQKALSAAIKESPAAETGGNAVSDEVLNLNDQIQEQKDRIEELKNQSDKYQEQINHNRSQAVSLVNEIALLDNQVAKTKIDIERTETEIDQTKLEIKKTNAEIKDKEEEIEKKKDYLSYYLRTINKSDNIEYLEILLLNNSFSEFFDQIQYLENMQSDIRNVLVEVIALKDELEENKRTLGRQEADLKKFALALENQQAGLEQKITAKGVILDETRESERTFQKLLAQTKAEQAAINSDLTILERKIRERLEASDSNFVPGGNVILSWPIPFNGITAYFHDPDYPFRYIFEHPAVDLRASQGTAIKAPAAGYVGRAKNSGYGYSYIMLIHNGGLATVYGHVSRILVSEDAYVTRGQIIGYTGGAPGTPGAGNLTTGPHLHFEVRLNGIPVNPLDYLIDL